MFFQIKDEVSSFRQKALLASNKLIYYYKFITTNLLMKIYPVYLLLFVLRGILFLKI